MCKSNAGMPIEENSQGSETWSDLNTKVGHEKRKKQNKEEKYAI